MNVIDERLFRGFLHVLSIVRCKCSSCLLGCGAICERITATSTVCAIVASRALTILGKLGGSLVVLHVNYKI